MTGPQPRGVAFAGADVVANAATRGKAVHIGCELVDRDPDLDLTLLPEATRGYVAAYRNFLRETFFQVQLSEERMVSTATMGEALVALEFPFGVDLNDALIRVNNALTRVPAYPENVDEPRLYTTSFSSNSFIFFRVSPLPGTPEGVDMNMMRDFVDDNVATVLERVPGVSEVGVGGGAERQVQIFVDPARLAERGITLTQLRSAVRERNLDVSGGDLNSGKRRYLLRTVGRFKNVEELEDVIIAARDNAKAVVISAQIEAQVEVLDPAERTEFLETLGLEEPGLNRLIREAFSLLGLQTYCTAGPKEARAWTITVGAPAPQAARQLLARPLRHGLIRDAPHPPGHPTVHGGPRFQAVRLGDHSIAAVLPTRSSHTGQ